MIALTRFSEGTTVYVRASEVVAVERRQGAFASTRIEFRNGRDVFVKEPLAQVLKMLAAW